MTQGRIKFTGYIDLDTLDPEDIDMDDPTGLSSTGYDRITSIGGELVPIAELEDLSVELNG